MNNFKLLILFGSLLFVFASCEPEDIEYPGEKDNKDLYSVNNSTVLYQSSFFSSYIQDMYNSKDSTLTIPLADAETFATAHLAASLNFFAPTGDLVEGTLRTSDEPIAVSDASISEALVYYFSNGSDSLAYQIYATGENTYKHQGFVYADGAFNLVIDATDGPLADHATYRTGQIDSLLDGTVVATTTWEFYQDSIEFVRTSGPKGQSSYLKMHAATQSGHMQYYVNSKLMANTTWSGTDLSGEGQLYDEDGKLVIEDKWPLIPVPADFDKYRMLLFSQDGFYQTMLDADAGTRPNASTDGTLGGWTNLYDEVINQASFIYIPSDAFVTASPSGLELTYKYDAPTGESIEYKIQATTPAYVHTVVVDGTTYFKAEESRDSQVRLTTIERLVNDETDGEGIAQFYQAGKNVYLLGRGSQSVPSWAYSMKVTPENANDWVAYYDNVATPSLDTYRTNPSQYWVGGNWTANAASGEYTPFWWDTVPDTVYPW